MRLWRLNAHRALLRVPRPLDSPNVTAPGRDVARILLFGAGLSVGWGVSTYNLAIPGFLAGTLSALTKRGIDIDAVVHPNTQLRTALQRLRGLHLWRYDAIVIVLGVVESLYLLPSKAWRQQLTAMLAELEESAGVPVVITGIQKIRSIPLYDSTLGGIADIHAAKLNRVSSQVCALAPHATFVPFPNFPAPESGRYRGPDTFAEAARVIAVALGPVLATPRHQATDPYPPLAHLADDAEEQRQAAVDALDLANPELSKAIDRILDATRGSLLATAAAFIVLDQERQLFRASGWIPPAEMPRTGSLCDATIRQWGGLIVPDTLSDERFHDAPLVIEDPHVRFYAGYPVESSSGDRIGVLCVLDTVPRDPASFDLDILRSLALGMERELHKIR